MKKTNKWFVVIVVGILLVLGFFRQISTYLIDYQWFKEMGYTEIFFKKIITQAEIWGPVFVVLFVIFFGFFKIINKHYIKTSAILMDTKTKKLRDRIFMGISLLIALVFSISFVNTIWYDFLTFVNQTNFGIVDPIFKKDVGFFIFSLPLLVKLQSFVMGIIVILAIITIGFNLMNFVTVREPRMQDSSEFNIRPISLFNAKTMYWNVLASASRQLAILGGFFFLLLGAGFFLKTFELLYSPRSIAYGAGYTDTHVTIPFYYLFIGLSVFSALVLFLMNKKTNYKLMLAGPVILIAAFVLSGVGASLLQSTFVGPNELSVEEKYIQYNIDYTNYAYGLDKVEIKQFNAEQTLTRKEIDENKTTINNIPINDYRPAKDTYNQIQGLKNYYTFNDIDLDRYTIDGVYKQVFVSARELLAENVPGQTTGGASWINRYLKYTHGYGIAMSPVTEVTSSGQPKLIIKDMPVASSVDIKLDKPQIYYGELTKDFAIVNTREKEFDYPNSDQVAETVYNGTGGIKMSFVNRLMFAVKEGKLNFLLSNDINSNSKVLINREIVDRVKKLVPYLAYDEDPYVVVADGRLFWVIDAYSVSDRYPYSEPINQGSNVNYIRNSAKVVIDAYNGNVDFYISDNTDPLIKTYSKIFKTVFKPLDKMPEALKSHLRYPQKIFDIQTEIYRKYHMKKARDLYNKSDIWDIATQIYGSKTSDKTSHTVESSYLIMRLPEAKKEEFLLMVPYTPQGKLNMISWFGVQCDGEDYGKLVLYKFPSGKVIEGPMQVEGIVSQDTIIGPQLNLLETGGNSAVIRGNMMAIPIGNSLLYVEPIYVKAVNANALPELKKVVVFYRNQTVMEDTLEKALAKIFPTKEGTPTDPTLTPPAGQPGTGGGTGTPVPPNVQELVKKANLVFTEAQNALKVGDWTTYGAKLKELGTLLKQLEGK